MLTTDPARRVTCAEALRHTWFNGMSVLDALFIRNSQRVRTPLMFPQSVLSDCITDGDHKLRVTHMCIWQISQAITVQRKKQN
jgi:hypothetical protein